MRSPIPALTGRPYMLPQSSPRKDRAVELVLAGEASPNPRPKLKAIGLDSPAVQNVRKRGRNEQARKEEQRVAAEERARCNAPSWHRRRGQVFIFGASAPTAARAHRVDADLRGRLERSKLDRCRVTFSQDKQSSLKTGPVPCSRLGHYSSRPHTGTAQSRSSARAP